MKASEVIGQSEAWQRLRQLADSGRMPHALLLYGPQGCGKLALALALASYLLGERQDDGTQWQGFDTARTENAEAMLHAWAHPDLHFSYPVIKPKNSSADYKPLCADYAREWNELLREGPYFTLDNWLQRMRTENQQAIYYEAEADALNNKFSVASTVGGLKVSVMWLAERMNAECANKMLKLIEEPPAGSVFIMTSEAPENMLETIVSRTQRIRIKGADTDDMAQALILRRGIEEQTAHRVARMAAGSWLKALEMLDAESENAQFLARFIDLTRMAYKREAMGMKAWSESTAGLGRERQKRMLAYFLRLVRENFAYNFGRPELCYMTMEEENFARNFARFINEDNVIPLSKLIQRAIRDLGQNANPKIVFFDFAIQTAALLRLRR